MNLEFLISVRSRILAQKRLIWQLLAAAAIIAAGILLAPKAVGLFELRRAEAKIKTNPEWTELYKSAKEGDTLLKKEKDIYDRYLATGFRWKSIADATGEPILYRKARSVYDAAIKRWPSRHYLSYQNAGNISRYLKEFEVAEEYYKKAIEINSGEASLWVMRAELWRYDLKKSHDEIKALYREGMFRLVGEENLLLIIDYASYLRAVDDFDEALKIYKLLAVVRPTYEPYQHIIAELEEKLNHQSKE